VLPTTESLMPRFGCRLSLVERARAAGVPAVVIRDAGRTQVEAGTRTVAAVGPGREDAVNDIVGTLRLL
jgi:peptidyl-tRNA hydrolase, PTH2 family